MPSPKNWIDSRGNRRCGARSKRHGGRCGHVPAKGRDRCKFHGGASTRPHNPRGWPKEAWARRAARQALYRAMGLPWHGGTPRKPAKVLTMAEEAKLNLDRAIVELEATLPPDVRDLPIDQLTAPQALGRASLVGLHQLVRIVEQPLDFENLKQLRLVGDMALGANKLLQRHAQGERNHDLIGKLLAAVAAEEAEKAGKIIEPE